MKTIALFFIGLFFSVLGFSQSTLVLQPGPSAGKDAYLPSQFPNTNFGNYTGIITNAWSNGPNFTTSTSIFQFDLSSLPPGTAIYDARLNLFKDPNPPQTGHMGDNSAYLKRVVYDWNENIITYNNQPLTTTVNQVILPASKTANQDYLNIDVTQLVTDMVNAPNNSFGFMLELITMQRFRSLVFASSDNVNTALRPKLVITYTLPCDTIHGTVTYSNASASPLQGVKVFLTDANNIKRDSTFTNIRGDFAFPACDPGNYTIVVKSDLPVKGINSFDALIALKHFTGMLQLDGLFFKAGDVDNNNIINSTDAVSILNRFIGRISTFPAGDWVFDRPNVTLPLTAPSHIVIKGLCVGDLNASRTP